MIYVNNRFEVVMDILCKRLKELRKIFGYSQQQIADILHVGRPTYVCYENDIHDPNLNTIVLLSKIFDVSCDYLLGVSDY